HTARRCAKEGGSPAEFRWLFVFKPGAGLVVCRPPARREARLVALGCVQRAFFHWVAVIVMRARAAAARSQPYGRLALSLAVEHRAARRPALLVSLHPYYHYHPGPASAGHSRL